MADTVTMPKLGFDMAEGTLVRWVITEGDSVEKGAVLAEIETDKATVEVESTFGGVLHRQLVKEGDVVPVGTPIAIIGAPGEKVEEQQASTEQIMEAASAGAPGSFTPEEIASKKEGAEQPSMGLVGEVKAKEGVPPEAVGQAPAEPAASAAEEAGIPGGRRASPLARRMAEEKGIDLSQVKGTGPQGRITRKDVEDFRPLAPQAAAPSAPSAAPAPVEKKVTLPTPVFSPVGPPPPDERIPLSRLRVAIGRRMTESKQQVPHFYVTHSYDMGPIMALRKQTNALLNEGEKISVNDFLIKAIALTLRQFPNLNASLDGDAVVRHGQVNIGVAVAVEGGLLTVVCKDADRKSLRQIATEVRSMAGRAREGRVKPDDIEGSTFSISNLGMFDVESFVAILNPPEAAILAVGSAREVPVVKDGEIKPGWRMNATISVDHRVSDGAEGAQFLQALAAYIEEPFRLLL